MTASVRCPGKHAEFAKAAARSTLLTSAHGSIIRLSVRLSDLDVSGLLRNPVRDRVIVGTPCPSRFYEHPLRFAQRIHPRGRTDLVRPELTKVVRAEVT